MSIYFYIFGIFPPTFFILYDKCNKTYCKVHCGLIFCELSGCDSRSLYHGNSYVKIKRISFFLIIQNNQKNINSISLFEKFHSRNFKYVKLFSINVLFFSNNLNILSLVYLLLFFTFIIDLTIYFPFLKITRKW